MLLKIKKLNISLTKICYIEKNFEGWFKYDMKEKLKKVVFPNTFIVFLLFNVSVVGLILIFRYHLEKHPVGYVVYGVSSYMLITVCVRIPAIVKKIKETLHANKYTDMYLTDKDLRMRISLYRGLLITVAFAMFKIILGFVYDSSWFFAMAGYNVILSLMRFVLIYRSQKKGLSEYEERKRELQSYHVCGWLVMILNVAVSVIIFMVIVQKKTIHYNMIAAIGLAAFTFYCFTRAVMNMVKYRNGKNPVYAAVKRIDMVKAIVSIFTLQVTMLTTFEGNGEAINMGLLNTFTGVSVIIAINTIGALMIYRVRKDFYRLENKEQ